MPMVRDFGAASTNTLIRLDDALEASKRVYPELVYVNEVKVLGVDVARFGDDRSVLFKRQGRVSFTPTPHNGLDTMEVAGRVARTIDEWQPDATFIDSTGLGGGVVDRLKELGYPVIGVDSASRPITGGKFLNRRAEMWSNLGEWIRDGGRIPDDQRLISELTTPTYKIDSRGLMVLESKADMKKRGLASPDLGDALALTFAAPVANRAVRQMLNQRGGSRRGLDYNPLSRR